VTLTRARSDNLCADTDAFLTQTNSPRLRKSFLFGSLKDISIADPQTILAPVFRRPGSEKAFPLLPAFAETGERD